MIGNASFHRGRDSKSFMDAAEVVPHEVHGDRMRVVL